MASARTIMVNGIAYLQVVEYKKTSDGKIKMDVIKSFGRDSLENRMKAEQFAASYDRLKEVAEQQKEKSGSGDLLKPALAIFGIILGAVVVGAIIKEVLGKDKD